MKKKPINTEEAESTEAASCSTIGRKRDHTLDACIKEAAINILDKIGFDKMTMDMVASQAKAGKATVYRRWTSKVELVKDALRWMSQNSVDLEHLPDTGDIRSDLLSLVKPHSIEYSERKLRIFAGLGSFFTESTGESESGLGEIFEPWNEVNRKLLKRAIERGEISADADIEMACEVINSVVSFRGMILKKSFDKKAYAELLDKILLPALKNPGAGESKKKK